MSSIHTVEVIPVNITKHPNANLLGVNDIFDGGYQCVGNLEDWKGKTKAYYVPPDNIVQVSRPEFSFLAKDAKADGWARIKAKKLRGIVSYGLMVPAPDDAVIGDDATELLGVKEYVSGGEGSGSNTPKGSKLDMGETCSAPSGLVIPKYDVENFRRYHSVFQEGEPVVIREKLDGQNVKYVYHEGEMFCGSRNLWKRQYPKIDHLTLEYFTENGIPEEKAKYMVEGAKKRANSTNWVWQTKEQVEQDVDGTRGSGNGPIDRFCKDHPGDVLFGESYGNIPSMSYGLKNGVLKFVAFDIYRSGKFVDPLEFARLMSEYKIPTAPLLSVDPTLYSFDRILELCDGQSLLCPTQIKEGIVLTPLIERWDYHCGRVKLKCVSPTYSEKKK